MARSKTALAGRRMAYAAPRRSNASYRAGRAKAASARTTTICPRTLGAVDVEGHAPGPGSFALHQLRVEAREPLVVPLVTEDFCFEPLER